MVRSGNGFRCTAQPGRRAKARGAAPWRAARVLGLVCLAGLAGLPQAASAEGAGSPAAPLAIGLTGNALTYAAAQQVAAVSNDRKSLTWRPMAESGASARAASLAAPMAPLAAAPRGTAVVARIDDTDRLIVRFRGASPALAGLRQSALLARTHETLNRRGLQVTQARLQAQGAVVLRLDQRLNILAAQTLARELAASDPAIDYVEPDRRLQLHGVPNDPRFAEQWHLAEPTTAAAGSANVSAINLPAAWERSTGAGVVVAVIDTGVRPHADLAANLLPGYDFISDTGMAGDGGGRDTEAWDIGNAVLANECGEGQAARNSLWHGTHVAGTLAAVTQNGAGVAGVAYGAKVLPVRVMGKCGGYLSDVADAVVWAAGGVVAGIPANPTPARVINLSMGVAGSCGPSLQAAVQAARSRGAVVVVSAGNASGDVAGYAPANCAGVITVTAVDRQGQRTFYANSGAAVTLAAPGGDMRAAVTGGILSTYNTGLGSPGLDTMGYLQGTSMAAPQVSGVAALMLARNPTLTPDEVEARLKSSARPFPTACAGCGAGLLDASAAVDAATGVSAGMASGASATGATTSAGTAVAAITALPESAFSPVAEREPNNSLATAQTISGTAVKIDAALSQETDTDHYRVSIGAGKTLQVLLTTSAEADYDLALYSDTGQLLGTRATRNTPGSDWSGENLSVRNVNPSAAAVIYLRVLWAAGSTGPLRGRYTLKLSQ